MPVLTRYQNSRRARTDPFREIGHSGLDTWGGYVNEDFLTDWNTLSKRVKNIEEMLYNSPVLGGALRLSIEMPIQQIDWYWTSEDGDDDPRLELLNDSWEAMSHSWSEHLSDALLFVFYGFAPFTIQYQRDGGRILWRKFKMLGQDSVMKWEFSEDGGLAGLWQYPQYWGEVIPIERTILYRFRRTKNNPEGESVLRPAWVPYYYSKNLMDIEAIGIERNLAGLPVVTMGEGSDPEEDGDDYKRAAEIARNIRNDEQAGIVLRPPHMNGGEPWKVELLSSGGLSKTIDTNMVISRYEKRMLAAALSQFIMLGMDNVGALATFEGATDFQAMLVDSLANNIAQAQTAYAMPRLMELNGFDSDGLQLEHTPAGKVDLEAFSNALSLMSDLLTWTPEDENVIRTILGLSEKTPEELEELQEEERARTAEAAERVRQQMQQNQNGQEPEDEDQLGAEVFVSSKAPDDDTRRKHEGKWERRMRSFLRDELPRVLRGAKQNS